MDAATEAHAQAVRLNELAYRKWLSKEAGLAYRKAEASRASADLAIARLLHEYLTKLPKADWTAYAHLGAVLMWQEAASNNKAADTPLRQKVLAAFRDAVRLDRGQFSEWISGHWHWFEPDLSLIELLVMACTPNPARLEDVPILLLAARQYVNQDESHKASALYKQLLPTLEKNWDAVLARASNQMLVELVNIYEQQGNTSKVRAVCLRFAERGVSDRHDTVLLYKTLLRADQLLMDWPVLAQHLENYHLEGGVKNGQGRRFNLLSAQAYTRMAKDNWFLLLKTQTHAALQDWSLAAATGLELTRTRPREPGSEYFLALCRLRSNDEQLRKLHWQACTVWRKQLEGKKNPEQFNVGAWLLLLDSGAPADEDLAALIKGRLLATADAPADFLCTYGAALLRANKARDAIDSLQRAVRQSSLPAREEFLLAQAYFAAGQAKAAQEALNRGKAAQAELDKSDAVAADSLLFWTLVELQLLRLQAEALLGRRPQP
jgi:hypothetical protein